MTMVNRTERKRKFNSKVRTGCNTCKERRVKCGEERPSCHRCVSTGRLCDGYETIRIAQASTNASGVLSLKWTIPTPQPPETSHQEQRAFHYFKTSLVWSLSGLYDCPILTHVVSMSMSEPVVQHAVIALGALGRCERMSLTSQEDNHLALRSYSKAMNALHARIAQQDQMTPELILTTCALFVVFELWQGGWEQAKSHLQSGLGILREMLEQSSVEAKDKTTMDVLIDGFEGLDIQISLFTSQRVQLNRAVGVAHSTRLPVAMHIENVFDASRPLNLQMAAMRELVHMIEQRTFEREGITRKEYSEFEWEQGRQLASLSRWEEAMNSLFSRMTTAREQQIARQLQLHHLCAKLMVSMCLSGGRELLWDRYTADFEQLLNISQIVIEVATSPNEKDASTFQGFSLNMGVIAPLYFMALKCRDPRLRHKTLDLLRLCNHQEGAWKGPTLASSAETVVHLEEQGLEIKEAGDVPEVNRLYQAFYDLAISDSIVYCKRRSFETDGRWLEYERQVK